MMDRLRRIATGAVVLGALAVLFLFNPAGNAVYPPCPFHHLTGYWCPGCGSLRATHELLHLHFAAAWALNPLFILCLPILAMARKEDGLVDRAFHHPSAPWITGIILVGFWILRNLPFAPFNLLAPH
jgi:hypothetical protein